MSSVLPVSYSIIINAPPSFVRSTLVDFSHWPSWSPTIRQVILARLPDPADQYLPQGPPVGTTLQVDLGIKFSGSIVANTPTEFAWGNALPFSLLTSRHSFAFHPVQEDDLKTDFVNSEKFEGGLIWATKWMMPSPGSPSHPFVRFNEAFKKRCEDLWEKRSET